MKRHESLQPLSREHHQGLLLCWKIRTGLAKNVPASRIKKYTDWFFQTHLIPHFDAEEKFIFPVLGESHAMIKKAMAEHNRLKRLFHEEGNVETSLNQIAEELEDHIRFEERTLFPLIQEEALPKQLKHIGEIHDEKPFIENTEDVFWK